MSGHCKWIWFVCFAGLLLPAAPAAVSERIDKTAVRTDAYGDRLPEGAVRRIGTVRWRQEGGAGSVAYSPDGKILAVVGSGGLIFLWDTATGKELRRIQITPKNERYLWGATSIDFSPDGKTLASLNRFTVQLWDVATGKRLRRLGPFGVDLTAPAHIFRFSPDGKKLAIGVETVNVALVDAGSGKTLRTLKGRKDAVLQAFAFSPDGRIAALGSLEFVYLWDTERGELLRKIKAAKRWIHALTFSDDGKTLAWGCAARIVVSETATGKERAVFTAKMESIKELGFTPDGKTLISGSQDGKVRFWDVAKQKLRSELDPRVQIGGSMVLSRDRKKVVLGAAYNTIRQWDVTTGKELFPELTAGHDAALHSVAYSADGKLLATGGTNQKIFLWDAATGKKIRQLKGNSANVVAFSPDGKQLASIWKWNKIVRIWNVATGEEILKLPHDDVETVPAVAFSSNGKILLSISWKRIKHLDYGETTLHVWDAANGRKLRHFSLPNVWPRATCISPGDSRLAAVAGYHGIVQLCDLTTGRVRPFQHGHGSSIYGLAFSPDGYSVISSSLDQTVRLWEVASGEEILTLKGHNRSVVAVAVSPDGRLIASAGGYDGYPLNAPNPHRIRIWDAFTGKELFHLEGHDSNVTALAFSPDGKQLVSGLNNTTALVWDLADKPRPPLLKKKLQAAELPTLWDDLAARADRAHRAIALLSADPEQAVALLKKRVQPTPKADPQRVQKWIADLDSNSFAVRSLATKNLTELDLQVEADLLKALKAKPPLEVHLRLEKILETLHGVPSPGVLRNLRAVAALERMDTPQARELLQSLTKSAPGTRMARAAESALQRLLERER